MRKPIIYDSITLTNTDSTNVATYDKNVIEGAELNLEPARTLVEDGQSAHDSYNASFKVESYDLSILDDARICTDASVDMVKSNITFNATPGSEGRMLKGLYIRGTKVYDGNRIKARITGSKITTISEIIAVDPIDPYAPIDGNEFVWQGLTYKVIVKNGLAWLDRNLGASRPAESSTDTQSYGDLYQWGRLTDGHEAPSSSTTSTLATTDTPGHGDFIVNSVSPRDWRDPKNDNLWQGADGINNPAPEGWRLPTEAEFTAERNTWSSQNTSGAFASALKIPVAGSRRSSDAEPVGLGNTAYFWLSDVSGDVSRRFTIRSNEAVFGTYARANGASVRCVRDLP